MTKAGPKSARRRGALACFACFQSLRLPGRCAGAALGAMSFCHRSLANGTLAIRPVPVAPAEVQAKRKWWRLTNNGPRMIAVYAEVPRNHLPITRVRNVYDR